MANRLKELRAVPPRRDRISNHMNPPTLYEIGIGIIVPTLASAPSCSTPDLVIVVSPWGGFSFPAPNKYSSIYTASFAGPSNAHFVMHHGLSTLLHDNYTLAGTRVMVGVYPIASVQEKDTPRQVLHELLMKRFNGCDVFTHSSMWSNSTWVFTVLQYIREPRVFHEFPNAIGVIPRPIDPLEGYKVQGYNIVSIAALEERLFAIWRRYYRKYEISVGPVRLRWLHDYTPHQIAPGQFGVPVKPKRVHQSYHPYHQHQRQRQPHLHPRSGIDPAFMIYDSDHTRPNPYNKSWGT